MQGIQCKHPHSYSQPAHFYVMQATPLFIAAGESGATHTSHGHFRAFAGTLRVRLFKARGTHMSAHLTPAYLDLQGVNPGCCFIVAGYGQAAMVEL